MQRETKQERAAPGQSWPCIQRHNWPNICIRRSPRNVHFRDVSALCAQQAPTIQTPPPLEEGTKVLSLVPKIEAQGTTMWSDFDAWHAHMRVRWRNQLIERKKRAAEFGEDDAGRLKFARRAGEAGGVRGFFQSRHHSMLNRYWEVLQVGFASRLAKLRVHVCILSVPQHVCKPSCDYVHIFCMHRVHASSRRVLQYSSQQTSLETYDQNCIAAMTYCRRKAHVIMRLSALKPAKH